MSRCLRAFAILVRTSYLFTTLLASVSGIWMLVQFSQPLLDPPPFAPSLDAKDLFAMTIALVLVVPSLRAFIRLLRQGELVPDSHLAERPVIAALVWLASAAGTALYLLVAWILLSTLPESRDVNLAGPLMLATMLYAFALLTGELVLVGRLNPRGALRSGTVC